jgi:protein-L-isoaspartate(D-aspartate) O-methyltransferase
MISEAQAFLKGRELMVERQLRRRDITDERVLAVMGDVPRHLFVDPSYQDRAYEDRPLPIGEGQTISQPYMVARMTELCALNSTDRVLEVGAGSGYQTAVLSRLCAQVFAVEILEPLMLRAAEILRALDCVNVTLELRDGSQGWIDNAPFDAILVAAGAPAIPAMLKDQLVDGGRLVIPVGGQDLQVLQLLTRRGAEFHCRDDTPCRFVNLRGMHGWDGRELS